jgi:hypothetical protein
LAPPGALIGLAQSVDVARMRRAVSYRFFAGPIETTNFSKARVLRFMRDP